MFINNMVFNCELSDIITEVRSQLAMNGIDIGKTRDAPKDIMVQCPFHGEHRPSAGIRKDDGQFHCFACHESHSLPKVISQWFGKTDDMIGAFGWQWLLKNFATMQVEERKDVNLDFSRNRNIRSSNMVDSVSSMDNRYVTGDELDKYRYTHPYWTERGIVDNYIIELFDLGYSPKERMITFPNLDKYGNCLFVAKRSIDKKFFNYPNDANKHVYGIYQLYQLQQFPKEVYITESMIDCLLLWQYGKYACALNGLGNNIQFKELSEMPCRKFILATDSDNAGMKARERIKQNVRGKMFTEVILPAMKKDIGECSEKEIKNLVEVF